jgi:hypothetical protein
MTFGTVTSPAPTTLGTGNYAQKVAERVTFPQISGRDAPGKTGLLAKPALIKQVGISVGKNPLISDRIVFFVADSNGGINLNFAADVSVPDNTTSIKVATLNVPRPVFSGVSYWVGLVSSIPANPSTGATSFRWGIVGGTPTARLDRTNFRTKTFFDIKSSLSAGPGSLSYQLYYDVLPTEPLNLNAVVSGGAETDVSLSWDAVVSDGGEAVTGYRLQFSTDNVTWLNLSSDTATTTRSYLASNLIPGTTYYFRVAALNLVSRLNGSDYSGPYSTVASASIPGATAGNAQSVVTVTVTDPEPNPVVFSDFGAGINFKSIDVQFGSEFLYNEIQATTQDSFAETQILDAPQSKALYGTRTYALTSLLSATDQEAALVARDYLTYYFQPQSRVQAIVVDLFTLTTEEKVQVLALEIDDFIQVNFTPNGIGDPKITDGLITGIAHRISITSHEVELRLRNQPLLFTLNSDSKGILDVNLLGP